MRSAEAHALLVEHDGRLPGLRVLLDDDELGQRLGSPATRSYLRYKPGTSAVSLVSVDGRAAIVHAWGAGAADKRAKSLRHVDPADVLLDDTDSGLLVVDAMTDRKLPALRQVVRGGGAGDWLGSLGHPVAKGASPRTLAHKPSRRWVGSIPLAVEGRQVVLRAYSRRELGGALAAHGLLEPSASDSVRLPRVLATHRHGLIALEHLPGTVLDEGVSAPALRCLGACLGGLHSSAPVADVGSSPTVALDGLSALDPVVGDLGGQAQRVAEAAVGELRRGPGAVIHGDFSLDQVVAQGHSFGVIDLDRVRIGNPLDDIASLLAASALAHLPGGSASARERMEQMRTAVLAGHASTWRSAHTDDLGARTALALLSRVGEPFRSGHPDWPRITRDLVALADDVRAGRRVA